ncbi:unnamed protein product [Closterium sp. NIES-53]
MGVAGVANPPALLRPVRPAALCAPCALLPCCPLHAPCTALPPTPPSPPPSPPSRAAVAAVGEGMGVAGVWHTLLLLLLRLPLLQLPLRGVACFVLLLVLIIPHFDYGGVSEHYASLVCSGCHHSFLTYFSRQSFSQLFPPTDLSQPHLLPGSPLPALAPHTEVTASLSARCELETRASTPERCEPETCASTPVRGRHVVCPRAPALPSTHRMALHLVRAANPSVTCLPAMVVTDPSFESAATSALVPELVDFTSLCRLDYDASHVFYSSSPPSVGSELALGCDVLEDRQFELECLAAAAPHLASTLLCPEGDPGALDIPTPRTYVPPPGANIVDGMWIFRVKRPPGSPPAFKARYVARGFSQPQRDYELHSLDFSRAFLQGSLHEAIWLRCPRGFTGSFPEGTQTFAVFVHRHFSAAILRSRVLQRFDFMWSSPQPTPLSTGHSLSAPPSDESVEPSGPYPEFVGCLMYLMTCTQPDLAFPLRLLARYVAPVHRAWGSCLEDEVQLCDAEIYAGAMAAQELRWLTYLLTDLGERPPSPPSLTKRIALRYFLMRELQQRGQLRLAYIATQANTADVFTKALGSSDHQRFCTALGLVPTLPHLFVS